VFGYGIGYAKVLLDNIIAFFYNYMIICLNQALHAPSGYDSSATNFWTWLW